MAADTILLLTAVVGLFTALAVLFGQIRSNRQIKQVRGEMKAVKGDVQGVHLLINSRMDELIETTRKLAHAKGVSDEKERKDRKR